MIRIEKLVKSYGTKVLLAEASYHFPAGERVALVGDNGTGKSTLLNIITGGEASDGGEVFYPPNLSVGYLPQEPNPRPEASVLVECEAGARPLMALRREMEAALLAMSEEASPHNAHLYEKAEASFRLAGGYGMAARASGILAGLGFSTAQLDLAPTSLSGGWRMRLELAKLFMQEPDFLILDEPTNHLDLPSLVWVEKYLLAFRGSLLFVSHDRALLNRLATYTLHLSGGRLTPYRGNFAAFEVASERRLAEERAQAQELGKRRQGLQEFVDRFGAKASKAKQAASKMKMIARIADEEALLDPLGPSKAAIAFTLPEPLRADRIVYEVTNAAIGYDSATPLSVGLSLQVERGQKIAIIGANGIGKSTLLKTLVGRLKPLAGEFSAGLKTKLAYFSQDQLEVMDPEKSVLDNVLLHADGGPQEARSILGGFLFRGDDVFKPVGVLSGGEKSRLGLAAVLIQKANFLLLDEPTNHLDMKSTSSLIKALQLYAGTVLFVSHDRSLINEVASHVFVMTGDGRAMLFAGTIDDYLRLAAVAGFPNVLEPAPVPSGASMAAEGALDGTTKGNGEGFKEFKKQKSKLEKEITRLDKEIERYQSEMAELDATLAACVASDYERLHREQQKRSKAEALLEAAEAAWLLAHEQLEEVLANIAGLGRS